MSFYNLTKPLTNFFRDHLPEVKKLEISNIKRILGGLETEIHYFKCKYETTDYKKDLELIIRIYHSQYANEFAESEFETLTKLKTLNYPVPKVYFKENSSKYIGKPFLIMDYIDGVTMGDLMEKALKSENPKALSELISQFSELLYKLHHLDWTSLVERGQLTQFDPKTQTINLINWYQARIEERRFYQLDPLIEWLHKTIDTVRFSRKNLSLVHGDFHPYNILVKNKEPFVIDWHGIRIRDNRTDLGQTSLLLTIYGSPDLRNAIVDTYVKYGGKAVDLHFFEVLAIMIRFFEFFETIYPDDNNEILPDRVQAFSTDFETMTKCYLMLNELTKQEFPQLKPSEFLDKKDK
ncbi:MAG: phosphotransferase family protein [Candidatus Hodarchaeales archaeon]